MVVLWGSKSCPDPKLQASIHITKVLRLGSREATLLKAASLEVEEIILL